MSQIEDQIIAAAEREGIDPATALAYASRESNFNPRARASRSMRGLYQMSGTLRNQYGVGDSDDVDAQTHAFAGLLNDNKRLMSQRLGRDVTDTEAYYGHHFGAGRAARMIQMDPETPVDQVFTPNERAQNPHFDRAGTVGNLLSSVGSDIDQRRARYGGDSTLDFSSQAHADDSVTAPSQSAPLDFSQFATAA